MKRHTIPFSAIMLMLMAACGTQENADPQAETENPPVILKAWASNALWDDGLAEVAQYEAERVVYGQARQYEYTHILVKEDFNQEYNVKTDDYSRRDLFPVMKVNQFAQIPTEKYPYHYLSSLFFKRTEPSTLHKMTVSSQEWCGNTFKAFDHKGNNYRYIFSSYWDKQGNEHMKLNGNLWFEDGLSYTLRTLDFKDGLTFKRKLMESQVNNKAGKPVIYNASFQVSADDTQSQQAWQVQVKLDDEKTLSYWFAREYPNILLKQESWDGRKLSLKSATRSAYWE